MRGGNDVIFFERNDARDATRARDVRGRHQVSGHTRLARNREQLVELLARPILIEQFLSRQQDDTRALATSFANELVAFEKTGDAKNGWNRGRVSHARLDLEFCGLSLNVNPRLGVPILRRDLARSHQRWMIKNCAGFCEKK